MPITIAIYGFVITLLVVLVVFRYLMGRRQIKERLNIFSGPATDDSASGEGVRGVIKNLGTHFEAVSWAIQKEELLMQAGIHFRGSEFLVISLGAAMSGTVLLLLLLGLSNWLLALVGGALAFNLPTVIVKQKIRKKQALLNEQLPNALTTMANSLRSGYSYLQAMDLISKEMPYPISEEFGFVVKEMNLGITTEEALTNLVKRVNTDDLDLTVTAFLIQRQVGGNLAELLDNIANTIKERVKMKDRISALTAQGKMSGWVLGLLPVIVIAALYFIQRDYIVSFLVDPRGRVAIGIGLVAQLCGAFWIKKIVDIDV